MGGFKFRGAAKIRVGVIFGQEAARLIAVLPGGGTPVRAVAAMPWKRRGEPEARQIFLQATAELLSGLDDRNPPAWISIPSREAALHVVQLAPSRLDRFFPPPPPPLERLTPLPPEAVRLAVRRAAPPNEGGEGLGQAAVVRSEVVEEALELAREAGLHPRALDLRAGVAAAAGLNLVEGRGQTLFILLHQAGAEWSFMTGQRLSLIGGTLRQADENDTPLAARACQQAIQLCGLENDFQVVLAGSQAQATAEELAVSAQYSQGPRPVPRALNARDVLPPGLEWEELAMHAFLAGAKQRPTFNLLPQTASTWMDRYDMTKRLAWGAAGVFVIWAALGLGGAWLAKARVESDMESARAKLSKLREETRQVRTRLAALDSVAQASRARRESDQLMGKVAALLPPEAWLERMDFHGNAIILYVGGTPKGRLAGMFPKSGPLSPMQPLKEVSSPGSGRAAVKVVLSLTDKPANIKRKKTTRKPPSKRNRKTGLQSSRAPGSKPLHIPGMPRDRR
jgi:hypothetical protein